MPRAALPKECLQLQNTILALEKAPALQRDECIYMWKSLQFIINAEGRKMQTFKKTETPTASFSKSTAEFSKVNLQ